MRVQKEKKKKTKLSDYSSEAVSSSTIFFQSRCFFFNWSAIARAVVAFADKPIASYAAPSFKYNIFAAFGIIT